MNKIWIVPISLAISLIIIGCFGYLYVLNLTDIHIEITLKMDDNFLQIIELLNYTITNSTGGVIQIKDEIFKMLMDEK